MKTTERELVARKLLDESLSACSDGGCVGLARDIKEYLATPDTKKISDDEILSVIKKVCGDFELMGLKIARAIEDVYGIN